MRGGERHKMCIHIVIHVPRHSGPPCKHICSGRGSQPHTQGWGEDHLSILKYFCSRDRHLSRGSVVSWYL